MEKRGFRRIVPVSVTALQLHTYHGQSYNPGETYEVDDQDLETVEVQGKATRTGAKKKPAEHGTYKTTELGETRTTDLNPPSKK